MQPLDSKVLSGFVAEGCNSGCSSSSVTGNQLDSNTNVLRKVVNKPLKLYIGLIAELNTITVIPIEGFKLFLRYHKEYLPL